MRNLHEFPTNYAQFASEKQNCVSNKFLPRHLNLLRCSFSASLHCYYQPKSPRKWAQAKMELNLFEQVDASHKQMLIKHIKSVQILYGIESMQNG